jgi:hypothetical protein
MRIFRYWYTLLLVGLLCTCLEEDVPDHGYPVVTTTVAEITAEGALFRGTIQYKYLNEVTDHGFVWGSDNTNLSLESSFFISLGKITSADFSAMARSTLAKGSAYYCRSFVKTKTKTVYGSSLKFVSLGSEGPVMTSFFPHEATYGDTLQVRGRNFNFKTEINLVTFEDITARVTEATDTLLKVIVPRNLLKVSNKIKVSILDNLSESTEYFKLQAPSILSVVNPVFTVCDTVTIEGENLLSFGDKPAVNLNYFSATVVSVSKKQIKFIFPWLTQNPVNLRISGKLFESTASFQLKEILPDVTSIVPETYAPGDTIAVQGSDWPLCQPFSVSLYDGYSNYYPAKIVKREANSLKLIAPDVCIRSAKLLMTGKNVSFLTTLTLKHKLPKIFSIVPAHGKINDEVVIRGENFTAYSWDGSTNLLTVTSATKTELRGKVKELLLTSPSINVTSTNCGGTTTVSDGFSYDPPEIISFTPQVITKWDEDIVIEGKNFSPNENKITINDIPVIFTPLAASSAGDKITLPARGIIVNDQVSKKMSGKIKITTKAGQSVTSSESLTINYESIWTPETNFPGGGRGRAVSITINGKAYVGMGYQDETLYSDWWEFDPTTSRWTRKASFLDKADYNFSGGVSANGKGYVGLLSMQKKWWQYDPVADQWERKADLPATGRASYFIFELNNRVYVGGGYGPSGEQFTDFWEYDPAADLWTEKARLPAVMYSISFSHKGKAYTFSRSGSALTSFEYDQIANQWTAKPVSGNIPSFASSWEVLKFDDYVILHGYQFSTPLLYKFIPESGSFTSKTSSVYGARRFIPAVFVLNNRGYIGLGVQNTWLSDMLSFDPEKLQ